MVLLTAQKGETYKRSVDGDSGLEGLLPFMGAGFIVRPNTVFPSHKKKGEIHFSG